MLTKLPSNSRLRLDGIRLANFFASFATDLGVKAGCVSIWMNIVKKHLSAEMKKASNDSEMKEASNSDIYRTISVVLIISALYKQEENVDYSDFFHGLKKFYKENALVLQYADFLAHSLYTGKIHGPEWDDLLTLVGFFIKGFDQESASAIVKSMIKNNLRCAIDANGFFREVYNNPSVHDELDSGSGIGSKIANLFKQEINFALKQS